MKTALSVTLLLIASAMFGQQDNGFVATKGYRIQQATNIPNDTKDTADFTDFFRKDNGFIILMHYSDNQDLFSVDRGGAESLIFLGKLNNVNSLEEKDSLLFSSDAMARGGDKTQTATVSKVYVKNSLETTGEKTYLFQLTFPDEIWNFVTTEVITGVEGM